MRKTIKKLIRYAIRAPSGHNSQPWKFRIGEDWIEVWADFGRRRPEVDPVDRELYISLGAAVANLMTAATAMGLRYQLKLWPETSEGLTATLWLEKDRNGKIEREKLRSIEKRQSNREKFEEKIIDPVELKEIRKAAKTKGVKVIFWKKGSKKNELAKLIYQSQLMWYKKQELVDELTKWLEKDVKERDSREKLWLTRLPEMTKRVDSFVNFDSRKIGEKSEKDKILLTNSPIAGVIASKNDDKMSWVRSGIAYELMALEATGRGIENGFLNPVVELKSQRKKLMEMMGGSYWPQLVFRLGYGENGPRSGRRPIEEVILTN